MREVRFTLVTLILAVLFIGRNALAAGTNIHGSVKDAQTGEPLIGASVLIVGTSLGASSDLNGRYSIENVPAGSYIIRVSYVGYENREIAVTIAEQAVVTENFNLKPVGIQGKSVIITAQASGQNSAINQQLSSNKITDVVSAAKIQELPDANAAESVGRLPGVFVLRSGGEGYEVVVRGLAPQYNEITINGIQMGSSDPSTRASDLSMISPNMLEGIEVSKTVTPDMDANVIGGVVNFDMRTAQARKPGVPQVSLLAQGGYNALSDAYNKYNNYKYVGSIEDRVLDNKLGVFAQVDLERRNFTSNQLSTGYTHAAGNNTTQYLITSLTLSDVPRDRQLYNGALDLDYKLPSGTIKMMNFLSSAITNTQKRTESFVISGTGVLYYGFTNWRGVLNRISNVLDYEQQLPIFDLDVKLAHTYSENKSPNYGMQFEKSSEVGLGEFTYLQNVSPQDVVNAANRDYSNTNLFYFDNVNDFSKSRALTASIDLKTDLILSNDVTAQIKFGGKYQYQTRSYSYSEYDTPQLLNSGAAVYTDNLINSYFGFPSSTGVNIPIASFIDPNYSYGTFLNGDYTMAAPLNLSMLTRLESLFLSNTENLAKNDPAHYSYDYYSSAINNYSGHETPAAVYAMATLNVGPQITIIPGVRYQTFQTNYTGVAGITSPESYFAYRSYDTTIARFKGYWLPDIALKYKPLSWFDVRLSYTNTLAYPDYADFVPKIDASGTSNVITWNNYDLVPAHAQNYDAYVSFYNNAVGLFTAGAFLKQISDMIYGWNFWIKGTGTLNYLPHNITSFNPNTTYQVYTTENSPYKSSVYGLELDWQTHFWYLPGILSGLVLDANYTHAKSQAKYPYVYSVSTGRTITYDTTSWTDRMVDQPDNIFNISLGFDYKGFSIRVAMLYQADIFTGPSVWPQLRSYTAAYRRWDIAAKQILPLSGLELYTDINNINGANDVQVIQGGPPSQIQDYGATADLGLRWKF